MHPGCPEPPGRSQPRLRGRGAGAGGGRRGQAEPRLPHAANTGQAGGEQALRAPVPWRGAASAWFLLKKRAEGAETAPGLCDASRTVCPAAATTALPAACNARDYTGSGSTN